MFLCQNKYSDSNTLYIEVLNKANMQIVHKFVRCCGSLMPVFGVRVSVTFHIMCVHISFSSVSVAEWPPFGK